MERPEPDPYDQLAEISCPEMRAIFQREFGLFDPDDPRTATLASGSGPNAMINQAIIDLRKPGKSGRTKRKRTA